MKQVILILGSNLGDSEAHIETAISKLEKSVGKVVKKTKILKNLPVEFVSSYIFRNIALILETDCSPAKLLKSVKTIEVEMGRVLDSKELSGYQDRIIDIDIVDYDGIVFVSEDLEIPHKKHFYHREFSKILLKELKLG